MAAQEGAGEFRRGFGGGFYFDEKAPAGRDAGEHFLKRGDFFTGPLDAFPTACVQGAELGEGLPGNFAVQPGGTAGVGVVNGDEPAIAGQVDIDFDGIGALRPGKADGGEGVFRGVK